MLSVLLLLLFAFVNKSKVFSYRILIVSRDHLLDDTNDTASEAATLRGFGRRLLEGTRKQNSCCHVTESYHACGGNPPNTKQEWPCILNP